MAFVFLAPTPVSRYQRPRLFLDLDALASGLPNPDVYDPADWGVDFETEEAGVRRAVNAARREAIAVLEAQTVDLGATTVEALTPKMLKTLMNMYNAALTTNVQKPIQHAFEKGVDAGLPEGIAFGLVNPQAVSWARYNAARLVKEISAVTDRGIREVIAQALKEGPAPVDVAKQILPLIGLTDRDVRAASNLQRNLLANGMDKALALKRFDRYVERALQRRARLIARTEVMFAANAGTVEGWKASERDGLINLAQWQKVWLATANERTCPICRPLDGVRVDAPDGVFPSGGGQRPPRHPACRCTVTLKEREPGAVTIVPPAPPVRSPESVLTAPEDFDTLPDRMGRVFDALSEGLSGYDRSRDAKQEVMQKLANRLRDNPAFTAIAPSYRNLSFSDDEIENAVANLIHEWANTSADNSEIALALQRAAADELNVKGFWKGYLDNVDEYVRKNTDDLYTQHGAGLRAFIRAQYDETQAWFRERGVTSVPAARGMHVSNVPSGVERKSAYLQPISSFSVNYPTAAGFAQNTIILSEIPVERIIGTPRTGFGCLEESELVVMAGPKDVTWSVQWDAYDQSGPYDLAGYLREVRRWKQEHGT